MENSETQTWLEFALACKYIEQNEFEMLLNLSEQVGSLLHHMMGNPEKYKQRIGKRQKAKGKGQKAKSKMQKAEGSRQKAEGKKQRAKSKRRFYELKVVAHQFYIKVE